VGPFGRERKVRAYREVSLATGGGWREGLGHQKERTNRVKIA